jgi:hypothetical protein
MDISIIHLHLYFITHLDNWLQAEYYVTMSEVRFLSIK